MVKKILKEIRAFFEALIYVLCYIFLFSVLAIALGFFIKVAIEDDIVKNYIIGILVIITSILSIIYITSYNNKHKKNDSNSSERPDYFIFEGDLPTEDRRYASNRRNVEQ